MKQIIHALIPGTLSRVEHFAWWDRVRLGSEGTVWLLLSLLLALFVQNISSVINPIGGLAAILMFVFPGICMMLIFSYSFVYLLSSNELASPDTYQAESAPVALVWCGHGLQLSTSSGIICVWDKCGVQYYERLWCAMMMPRSFSAHAQCKYKVHLYSVCRPLTEKSVGSGVSGSTAVSPLLEIRPCCERVILLGLSQKLPGLLRGRCSCVCVRVSVMCVFVVIRIWVVVRAKKRLQPQWMSLLLLYIVNQSHVHTTLTEHHRLLQHPHTVTIVLHHIIMFLLPTCQPSLTIPTCSQLPDCRLTARLVATDHSSITIHLMWAGQPHSHQQTNWWNSTLPSALSSGDCRPGLRHGSELHSNQPHCPLGCHCSSSDQYRVSSVSLSHNLSKLTCLSQLCNVLCALKTYCRLRWRLTWPSA